MERNVIMMASASVARVEKVKTVVAVMEAMEPRWMLSDSPLGLAWPPAGPVWPAAHATLPSVRAALAANTPAVQADADVPLCVAVPCGKKIVPLGRTERPWPFM